MQSLVTLVLLLSTAQALDTKLIKNLKGVPKDLRFGLTDKNSYSGSFQADCGEGEYLNLCAECVSGQTEKEDGFGADSCGVCGGLDTCQLSCTDPMADIDQEPSQEPTGCMKLISITPSVLDVAESAEGSVCILGEGITPESLPSLDCTLRKDMTDIVKFEGAVGEDVVHLSFPLPKQVGSYQLFCNSSTGVDLKEVLKVVDSGGLQPMAVDKSALVTWTENQVKVSVGKLVGPEAVLCFARSEGEVLYSEWSKAVQGNGLSSTVLCPRVILLRPGQVEFGVAYSAPAIKHTKTVKVTGVAVSPNPVSAVYSPDSSKVIITFDQNLDEDSVTGCETIFKDSSLGVFGKDAVCEVLSNEIQVEVKDKSALGNTVLQFSDSVRTKFSEVAVEGSITLDLHHPQQGKEELRLRGNEKICAGDSTEVTLEGAQGDWSLQVSPWNLSNIPVSQRQRLNMISWRANRSSRASPKGYTFTSNSKMAGVKYELAGKRVGGGVAKLEVSVASPGEMWAQLEGPATLNLASFTHFNVSLISCGRQAPQPDKYVWEVRSERGDVIETTLQNGPDLHLDGSLFKLNRDYTVSVKILEGDNLLGKDEMRVKTLVDSFQLNLPQTDIVVGTGHPIEIDATKAVSLNEGMVKFKWTCTSGYCSHPGPDKKPLELFSQPVLRLPAKSLPIGKYVFEVEGVTEFGKAYSDLYVEVISGQPPYWRKLWISDPDPGKDLEVSVEVAEVIGHCDFYWRVVPAVGLSYIYINESRRVLGGSPHSPGSGELRLTLPRSGLKGGAKYKLRAVADCGRLTQSHLEFCLFIPQRFPPLTLKVDPISGHALETYFTYTVECNETQGKYIYSYGFEENGITKFLFSSHSTDWTTILGHGIYKPLVKICRTKLDCMTVIGAEISTASAKMLTESDLRKLMKTYIDLVLSNSFSEANSFLEMIVPAIKENYSVKYENFSYEVQKFIMDRILIYTERLKTDRACLEDALQLLDSATTVLNLLTNSEEAIKAILKFKDLIHQTTQVLSDKKTVSKISSKLAAEHKRNPTDITRPKRKTIKQRNDQSEMMVNSIFKLASSLSNNTNNTKETIQGKIKILNDLLTYTGQFCNELEESSGKEAGSATEFGLVGARKLKTEKERKKIKFPQCINSECPNITGEATVTPANSSVDSLKTQEFCFTTLYLRDDILSEVSLATLNSKVLRWSPVYWLDLLPYKSGVVDDGTDSINLFSVANGTTTNSSLSNGTELRSKGNILIKIPLSKVSPPGGTVLQCSRYEFGRWNFKSCKTKNKKNFPNYQFCVCPYPGFFSVFAVSLNPTANSTSPNMVGSPSITTSTPTGTDKPTGTTLRTVVTPNAVGGKGAEMITTSEPSGNETEATTVKPTVGAGVDPVESQGKVTTVKTTVGGGVDPVESQGKVTTVKTTVGDGVDPVESQGKVTTVKTTVGAGVDPVGSQGKVTTVKTTVGAGVDPVGSQGKVTTVKTTVGGGVDPVGSQGKVTTVGGGVESSGRKVTRVVGGGSESSGGQGKVTTSKTPVAGGTEASKHHTASPPLGDSGDRHNQTHLNTTAQLTYYYKYMAYFRINESFSDKVGDKKNEFACNVENQLKSNLNLTFPISVGAEGDGIRVTLQMEERKLSDESHQLASLASLLRNGSLLLRGLEGDLLHLPRQEIHISQTRKPVSSALTAVLSVVFVLLLLLVSSLVFAVYLRTTREHRSIRITQVSDLYEEPPAPKYLRLHDSVSLGSSSPSLANEMESSLAVVTRSRSRGYEAVDQFSNLPGNI